jgi:ABC-type transport system involved in multi-copper enzyme maturation permease subunit
MTSPSAVPWDVDSLPATPPTQEATFRRALHYLHYEWVALRSLRAPWVLCGSAVAAQILTDITIGRDHTAGGQQFASGLQGVTLIGFALFAALGVNVLGSEYRHGTIARTVLTLRDRRGILLAKMTLTAAVTAAASAVMVLVNALTVPVLGGSSVSLSRVCALGAAAVLYAALCALAGLAVAGLTRNPVLSIAVVILWPTLLERLVILATHVSPKLAPFTAAAAQAQGQNGTGPQWVLVLPLVVLTAVLLALAGVLFSRRDV